MIRDPSDGSAKEKPKPMVSGLAEPGIPVSTDELERLEKSRQWLKNYVYQNSGISKGSV